MCAIPSMASRARQLHGGWLIKSAFTPHHPVFRFPAHERTHVHVTMRFNRLDFTHSPSSSTTTTVKPPPLQPPPSSPPRLYPPFLRRFLPPGHRQRMHWNSDRYKRRHQPPTPRTIYLENHRQLDGCHHPPSYNPSNTRSPHRVYKIIDCDIYVNGDTYPSHGRLYVYDTSSSFYDTSKPDEGRTYRPFYRRRHQFKYSKLDTHPLA